MKYCPKCGAKLEDDYSYCPKCGFKFDEEKKQPANNVEEDQVNSVKQMKKKMSTKGKIAVFFCIVIVLLPILIDGGFYICDTINRAIQNRKKKTAPTLSTESEELGTQVVFVLHANDDYDSVVANYKLLDSAENILTTSNLYWTVLTKGNDYRKEIDISSYILTARVVRYSITSYE